MNRMNNEICIENDLDVERNYKWRRRRIKWMWNVSNGQNENSIVWTREMTEMNGMVERKSIWRKRSRTQRPRTNEKSAPWEKRREPMQQRGSRPRHPGGEQRNEAPTPDVHVLHHPGTRERNPSPAELIEKWNRNESRMHHPENASNGERWENLPRNEWNLGMNEQPSRQVRAGRQNSRTVNAGDPPTPPRSRHATQAGRNPESHCLQRAETSREPRNGEPRKTPAGRMHPREIQKIPGSVPVI